MSGKLLSVSLKSAERTKENLFAPSQAPILGSCIKQASNTLYVSSVRLDSRERREQGTARTQKYTLKRLTRSLSSIIVRLESGECIQLSQRGRTRILIECTGLEHVAPSTASRGGVMHVGPDVVGTRAMVSVHELAAMCECAHMYVYIIVCVCVCVCACVVNNIL
jgi:hypothetical protein